MAVTVGGVALLATPDGSVPPDPSSGSRRPAPNDRPTSTPPSLEESVNAFGNGATVPSVVYVQDRARSLAESGTNGEAGEPVPEEVQSAITAGMSDTADIEWVNGGRCGPPDPEPGRRTRAVLQHARTQFTAHHTSTPFRQRPPGRGERGGNRPRGQSEVRCLLVHTYVVDQTLTGGRSPDTPRRWDQLTPSLSRLTVVPNSLGRRGRTGQGGRHRALKTNQLPRPCQNRTAQGPIIGCGTVAVTQ
jgi:hypothetical protein